jgi:hypothetical protein
LTGSGGAVLGAFSVLRFSSIGGIVSNIGSVTIKCEFGANSGSWLTSSTVAINSGGGVFSFPSYGRHANISLSQASSQSLAAVFVYGAP